MLCDCIAFLNERLDTVGLFRVPGNQDTVNALRAKYEVASSLVDDTDDVLSSIAVEAHDVATLFKLFLRQLPEPLVPMHMYDTVLSTAAKLGDQLASDEGGVIQPVLNVVKEIPSPHRECLGMVVQFLFRVSTFASVNKMGAGNLAVCLAPTLIRTPDGIDPRQALLDLKTIIEVTSLLIRHADKLGAPKSREIAAHTRYKG